VLDSRSQDGEQVAQDKQGCGRRRRGGDDAKHVKHANVSTQGDTALVNSDSNTPTDLAAQ